MKDINIDYLKEILINNESITDEEREEVVKALDTFLNYNVDLNKDKDFQALLTEGLEFLKQDGINREDKLLTDYGLTADSTVEEIEAKRDELVDELSKKIKSTKYIDKARRLREKKNRLIEDFDNILAHKDNRSLSGDLRTKVVKSKKNETLLEYGKLITSLEEFAIETDDTEEIEDEAKETINYAYEAMSEAEIEAAKKDLEEHPINTNKYGDNIHDYYEPIEYFPNTNVRKPRIQGPFESTEHYNAFLAEYYSKYDFTKNEETKEEETNTFYDDKIDYLKTKVQGYFNDIKDSLTSLRWLYNHALNEKDNDEELAKFVEAYDQRLESVNNITGKLFNEKTLTGDVVLQVELAKDGDILSPYIAVIDEEHRKKFANYAVDADGNKTVDDDWKENINDVTNQSLSDLLYDYIDAVIDEVEDLDYETITRGNVEVIVDGKSYVMPVADFGIDTFKILGLPVEQYVREDAKENTKTKTLVNNSANYDDLSKEEIETRLNELQSEMNYRTHEENGLEEQEADDNLIEEYRELQDRLEAFADEVVEEDNQEPITYPAYNEEDARMNDILDNLDNTPEVDENLSEEERLDKLLEEVQEVQEEEEEKIVSPYPAYNEEDARMNEMLENLGKSTEEEVKEETTTEVKDETDDLRARLDEVESQIDKPEIDLIYGEDISKNYKEPVSSDEQPEVGLIYGEDISDKIDPELKDKIEKIAGVTKEEEKTEEVVEEEAKEETTTDVKYVPEPLPIGIEDKQMKLEGKYKVVAAKKPKYTKTTAALAAIGGALTVFGLGSAGVAATAVGTLGITALVSDVLLNLDNLKRAARKFKLKKLAKRHDAKVYFGRNDDIAMRNTDGTQILDDKVQEINDDLDETFNKKIQSIINNFTPRVSFDNLKNLFILEGDTYDEKKTDSIYVSNEIDQLDYEENIQNGPSKFESVKTDIDLFNDDGITPEEISVEPVKYDANEAAIEAINNEVQEQIVEDVEAIQEEDKKEEEKVDYSAEQAELEELRRLKAELDSPTYFQDQAAKVVEQIKQLNPGIADAIKEDETGYFISIADPSSIKLPDGFYYDGASAITNRDNVSGNQVQVIIGVIPEVEYEVKDPIEEIIEIYGEELLNIDLNAVANLNPKYSLEQFEEAKSKISTGQVRK